MKTYTLNPFLSSLAPHGIRPTVRDYERIRLVLQTDGPWSMTRFRDTLMSLLVKDEEQQTVFLKRFEEFFGTEAETGYEDIDVDLALADLKALARGKYIPPMPKISGEIKAAVRETVRKYGLPIAIGFALFVTLLLLATSMLYFRNATSMSSGSDMVPSVFSKNEGEKKMFEHLSLPNIPNAFSKSVLDVKDIRIPEKSKKHMGIAGCLMVAALLYGIYLWRWRKPPRDTPPSWNEEGPRLYSPGRIGGKPAPRLDDAVLNRLAESMGYFRSEQAGKTLDVPASVTATVNKSGIPDIRFCKRKQLRSLLILEDMLDKTAARNPVARELAQGMIRRGIPVLHGRFKGSPKKFCASDGKVLRLEDLEAQRQGYLMLIFTQGEELRQPKNAFTMEALARWPMVAWMTHPEAEFNEKIIHLSAKYDIPLCPATAEGILGAVGRFVTEKGKDGTSLISDTPGRRIPERTEMPFDTYAEELLGDALLWAQDCAMMPVVSRGLADALRRNFHSHLPPERMERLYALPGTTEHVWGLRFSKDVMNVLRKGFVTRREDREQEAVMGFLVKEIEKTEPPERDSFAHLTWEAVRERVRVELDRDNHLKRLSQLARTPLGNFIRESFEGFGFPGQKDKIPLRFRPRNRHALQRLGRIAEHLDIPRLEAYPLGWTHKIVMGAILLLFLNFSIRGADSFLSASNWEILGGDKNVFAQLEIRNGNAWHPDRAGSISSLTGKPLAEDRDYRITFHDESGTRISKIFSSSGKGVTRISVGVSSEKKIRVAQKICKNSL